MVSRRDFLNISHPRRVPSKLAHLPVLKSHGSQWSFRFVTPLFFRHAGSIAGSTLSFDAYILTFWPRSDKRKRRRANEPWATSTILSVRPYRVTCIWWLESVFRRYIPWYDDRLGVSMLYILSILDLSCAACLGSPSSRQVSFHFRVPVFYPDFEGWKTYFYYMNYGQDSMSVKLLVSFVDFYTLLSIN